MIGVPPAPTLRAQARIVVADGLDPAGVARLERGGAVAVFGGLGEAALIEALAEADAVIVRSRSRLTARVLEAAPRLRVAARAGVGVDNIDVDVATRRGILVLNTRESSTTSTAEHTMALLLALARHVPAAAASVARGEWTRERFVGTELYGKTLGIVGLGKIGGEVARRAQAFGMTVVAHDLYVSEDRAGRLGAQLLPLDDLLAASDVVTLHVPLTARTRHLIGADQLRRMKPGALLVNCARGELVDEDALRVALDEGRLGGAALDVFAHEPPGGSPLVGHPRVVATPHLGASTREAQRSVALEAADQVLAALEGRPVRGAVNAPAVLDEAWQRLGPFLALTRHLGSVAQQLARGPVASVELLYAGEVAAEEPAPLTAAFLAGLFAGTSTRPVNMISAPALARDRGLAISEVRREESEDFQSLVAVSLIAGGGPLRLAGTLFGRREPRIVQVDDYRLDLIPAPHLLLVWNTDRPGMIGRVGSVLGAHAVNIANMHVGRITPGGTALMVLTVDAAPPAPVLAELAAIDGISDVRAVRLD
ncbi:MAG: phosphoglycerate dehydrogenase [Armatimonadota bacterium]|nr:phosphoglycerate dehydrogenase [Armatimonadota bacterium]